MPSSQDSFATENNNTINNNTTLGNFSFPMTQQEVLQRFSLYMTPFERDEVKQF